VIVDVLLAGRDAEHPLANRRRQAMLDELGPLRIPNPRIQPPGRPERSIHRAQQQRARVRSSATPSKSATALRPWTRAKAIVSVPQSACTEEILLSQLTRSRKAAFADSRS
jgi:hypothetical protein